MFDALIRNRPHHATIAAYLALFIAVGGTAYGAARIGSPEIINNSLKSVDIGGVPGAGETRSDVAPL